MVWAASSCFFFRPPQSHQNWLKPTPKGPGGAGPWLATEEATQPRTGGNDWLYWDLAGDSALAAKADLCD